MRWKALSPQSQPKLALVAENMSPHLCGPILGVRYVEELALYGPKYSLVEASLGFVSHSRLPMPELLNRVKIECCTADKLTDLLDDDMNVTAVLDSPMHSETSAIPSQQPSCQLHHLTARTPAFCNGDREPILTTRIDDAHQQGQTAAS